MVSALITFLGFSDRLKVYLNTSGNTIVFKFQIGGEWRLHTYLRYVCRGMLGGRLEVCRE